VSSEIFLFLVQKRKIRVHKKHTKTVRFYRLQFPKCHKLSVSLLQFYTAKSVTNFYDNTNFMASFSQVVPLTTKIHAVTSKKTVVACTITWSSSC